MLGWICVSPCSRLHPVDDWAKQIGSLRPITSTSTGGLKSLFFVPVGLLFFFLFGFLLWFRFGTVFFFHYLSTHCPLYLLLTKE